MYVHWIFDEKKIIHFDFLIENFNMYIVYQANFFFNFW